MSLASGRLLRVVGLRWCRCFTPGRLRLDSGETPWKYCWVNLRLASGLTLCAALGCLPESSDLSEYSAEWAEADGVFAGGSFGGVAGAGFGGSSPVGQGGSGAQPAGSNGGGLGGAGSMPVATAGASSSDGGFAGAPPLVGAAGTETAPEPPGPCSDGVPVAETGRCYFVSMEVATWQDARLACVAWEGELVKVESPAEDELLSTLVDESIWLGASDTVVDNVYVWTDGSPILLDSWGPQQPDAFVGSTDCIEKRAAAGGLWFDQPCDAPYLFVCEKPLG